MQCSKHDKTINNNTQRVLNKDKLSYQRNNLPVSKLGSLNFEFTEESVNLSVTKSGENEKLEMI